MTKLRTVAIAMIALYARQGIAAGLLEISDETTILVSADESWEEAEQDIFHFRGSFELRTPRWAVTADEATVYGELDDLKRIVAEGSPVRFVFQNPELENGLLTRAEGQRLEYEKDKGLLHLSGGAKLANGAQVMRSSELRYDLEKEKLEAGGPEGVQITAKPKPRQ
jgi:lipopolysaccharide transport protein LptA